MSIGIRSILEWGILGLSALIYNITGRTPARGFFALLRLHSFSNGHSTQWLAHFVRQIKGLDNSIESAPTGNLIQPLKQKECENLLESLKSDGYAVYPYRLSPEVCERLRNYCKEVQGAEWHFEGQTENRRTYEERSGKTVKIQFNSDELTGSNDVQSLLADGTLIKLIQASLGSSPVLDSVVAWWSFATTGKASAEIAQMYHYDMERIQWLKVFFYLTDVGPENGPHVYVKGSHKPELCSKGLLGRGYVRIPDADIEAAYGKDRIVEVCAPAGTILFGNTMAQHKGKAPEKGERLILELQYTSSLFGGNLGRIPVKGKVIDELSQMQKKFPSVFQQLSIGN